MVQLIQSEVSPAYQIAQRCICQELRITGSTIRVVLSKKINL